MPPPGVLAAGPPPALTGAAAERPRLEATSRAGAHVEARLWSHAGGRFRAPAAAHPSFELAWVEEGQLVYRIGGRDHVVRAGEALVVPAGVEHATSFATATRAGALALSSEMVAHVADALGRSAQALEPGRVIGATSVASLGRILRTEATNGGAGHLLAVESIAEAMAIALVRGTTAPPERAAGSDPRVRAAIELVHASYASPIQVGELASAAGMSRFHFSRLFRDATGASPYQYLLRTRIERAAELLRTGRSSVTEVAYSVGFGDLGRFARSFQAIIGTTPSRFARGSGG